MSIVTTGLILNLDASDPESYPGTGSTWYDLSGNGYNFTLQNSPTWDNSGYFTFNGTNQYARLDSPANSLINWATTDYTCCFWVYNTSFTSSQNGAFVGFGNSETNNVQYWTLGTNSSGLVGLYMYNGGPDSYYSSTTLSLNTWNYLSLVQTGGNIYLYANGVLCKTDTVAGTPQYNNSYPMNLGGTSGFINGRVYAAQVYNIALNASQILQNYQSSPYVPATGNVRVTQSSFSTLVQSTTANVNITQNSLSTLVRSTTANVRVTQEAILVLIPSQPSNAYLETVNVYII
jgi:hypothetical protein